MHRDVWDNAILRIGEVDVETAEVGLFFEVLVDLGVVADDLGVGFEDAELLCAIDA
jgi:hypothetical protein